MLQSISLEKGHAIFGSTCNEHQNGLWSQESQFKSKCVNSDSNMSYNVLLIFK